MTQSAEVLSRSGVSDAPVVYEQPLSERMRTFLRLENLYQQLLFHIEQPSQWGSRASVTGLLDIIAILGRGDVRNDVLKELERQSYVFDRLQNAPTVDEGRLGGVLRNLKTLRQELIAVGPQYLQPIRESEFLSAIKHRSAIPGGTCEFDLPDYSQWLRKPYEERLADLDRWLVAVRPLCDSVAELLWLLRESGESNTQIAVNGVFQYAMGREASAALLRVALPSGTALYPEISASHHRFTVRFMQWSDVQERATQTDRNIRFELKIC
jgi:cell division protein ZapD